MNIVFLAKIGKSSLKNHFFGKNFTCPSPFASSWVVRSGSTADLRKIIIYSIIMIIWKKDIIRPWSTADLRISQLWLWKVSTIYELSKQLKFWHKNRFILLSYSVTQYNNWYLTKATMWSVCELKQFEQGGKTRPKMKNIWTNSDQI